MNTLGGYDLEDLAWPDEAAPWGVEAAVATSLAGTPIIWERARIGGRPIDLVGGAGSGWLPRATIMALAALASVPGQVLDLVWSGKVIPVRFRNEDHPAIEAEPVRPGPDVPEGMKYRNVTIKLMEV